jgi:type VI secretion system protein ImpL
MDRLLARNDWLSSAAAMTTLDNPYYQCITRMDQEMAAIRDIRPQAGTARLAGELVHILQSYRSGQDKAGLQARIAEKLQRIEAHLDRRDNIMAAAEAFGDYMQQLDALVPVTADANAAFRFAVQHFGQTDAQAEASPVILALGAVNQMRALLGADPAADGTLWSLVDGPLRFLVTLTTYETACGLNDVWQSQVVAETAGTPERQLWGALFCDKGVVPDFLAEPAKPFLRRTREGWSSAAWMGVTFPFDAAFLSFLDQGAVRRQQLQPRYTVSIATLPTDVNEEARSEAYQTRLTLQCAGRPQVLDNYNAPANKDFVWDPDSCDDVTLTIYFEETTLTRSWKGQWGFRDFLRTFRDGRKIYTPDDFPQQRADLKRIGVWRIQVNYILKDAAPVMAIAHYPPLNVPQRVARCWSGLGAATAGEDGGQRAPQRHGTATTRGAKR